MKSVTTILSRCRRAKEYLTTALASGGFWFVLAKVDPWFDDDDPPFPALSLRVLPRTQGFLYVHRASLVYERDDGPVETPQGRYMPLAATSLYEELAFAKAWHVYLEGSLLASQASNLEGYRALGICYDLELEDSAPLTSYQQRHGFITPELVSKYFLDWVSFMPFVERTFNTSHRIQIVRTFS